MGGGEASAPLASSNPRGDGETEDDDPSSREEEEEGVGVVGAYATTAAAAASHHPPAESLPLPTSPWILLTDTPALSNLDDVLREVGRIVDIEARRGIVDLDAAERLLASSDNAADFDLPLWDRSASDGPVLEARLYLHDRSGGEA